MKNYLPSLGILLFCILYIAAATKYPGGSQADPQSIGFDWIHNYWCNLLPPTAINGQINTARPIAITAMCCLCSSLALLFYQFPNNYPSNNHWDKIIPISGFLSMFFALLLFTPYHDQMIPLSSLFGLVTIIGLLKALYHHKALLLLCTAFFCCILLVINNYIYYTQHGLFALPFLQKITFLFVLLWLVALNINPTKTISP